MKVSSRVISFVLALLLCLSLVPAMTITAYGAEATKDQATMNYMSSIYSKALKNSGKSKFNGYCGSCVAHQLYAIGVNTAVIQKNGNKTYGYYSKLTKTTGGYYVKTYPNCKSLEDLVNTLDEENTTGEYTLTVVGFQKGSDSLAGQDYGHTLLIYKVYNGYVYWTESYGAKCRYDTIAEFLDLYGKSTSGKGYSKEKKVYYDYTTNVYDGAAKFYKCTHTFSSSGVCTKCGVVSAANCIKTSVNAADPYLIPNKTSIFIPISGSIIVQTFKTPYAGDDNRSTAIPLTSIAYAHLSKEINNTANETWYAVDSYCTNDGTTHTGTCYIPGEYLAVCSRQTDKPPTPSNIKINLTAPTADKILSKGKDCPMKGTITSTAGFSSITGVLSDSQKEFPAVSVAAKKIKNATSFKITDSDWDKKLTFDKLAEGPCQLVITVTDKNGTQEVKTLDFTIKDTTVKECAISHTIKPVGGGKSVTLTAFPETAKISGTINGEDFSAEGSYTFVVTEDSEVNAAASQSGYVRSPKITFDVSVPTVATPEMSCEACAEGTRVTLTCATANATIYYETAGEPIKYTGSFTVSEDTDILAYAKCSGYHDGGGIFETVTVDTTQPTVVKAQKEKIARGDSVTVSWNGLPFAQSYTVKLFNEDRTQLLQTAQVPGCMTSFVLKNAGSYQITVTPCNKQGEPGTESEPITVQAMPDCTVRYLDYDDTEYLSRQVRYGYAAEELQSVPTRKGYQFVAWTGDSLSEVTGDITVKASYQRMQYTVRFYDYNGGVTSQQVYYGDSAQEPNHPVTEPGYVFGGWAVTYVKDNTSNCDWKCVDSDMDLKAVKVLENPDLPILLDITSARRDGSRGVYTVSADAANLSEEEAQTIYLRIVLLNDKGQMVKTGYQEVRLDPKSTATRDITLNYDDSLGKAVTARAYALGIRGTDKTGSALAEEASAAITDDGVEWSAWSDWSQEPVEASANQQVRTATQYRSRNKETFLSVLPLDPAIWTRGDEVTTWGEWSDWSTEEITAVEGRINVETQEVAPVMEKQYRYFRYYGKLNAAGAEKTGKSVGASWSYFCPNHAKKYLQSGYTTKYTPWSAKKLTRNTDWGSQSCSCHGKHTAYKYNGVNYYAGPDGPLTREVVKTAGYTQYRYQMSSPAYLYWRWNDWSDWSMTKPTATADCEVESATFFSYCTRTDDAQTTASVPETQNVEGTLPVGVDDFSGKLATVMVYNVKNTDPNESQIQYVGQTEIKDGNAYHFSFIPKADPTVDSGDYIVALGIQGASDLINVDVIDAPKPTYSVKFLDMDGTQIGQTQTVEEGGNAVLPAAPSHDGYSFVAWNGSANNITADTTISAIYTEETYAVVFVDWLNENIILQKYRHDQPLNVPSAPTAQGHSFVDWRMGDDTVSNGCKVTADRIVYANYTPDVYTVTFLDANGDVLDEQRVAYGESAVLPDFAAPEGQEFLGWGTQSIWWNVTEDMTVEPIIVFAQTTQTPESVFGNEVCADGSELELFCNDADAQIYYTLDGGVPSLETLVDEESTEQPMLLFSAADTFEESETSVTYLYTDPIVLETPGVIRAIAVADGKNISDELSVSVLEAMEEEESDAWENDLISVGKYTVEPDGEQPIDVSISLQGSELINGFCYQINCDRTLFYLDYLDSGYNITLPECCPDAQILENDAGYEIIWISDELIPAEEIAITLHFNVVSGVEAESREFSLFADVYSSETDDFMQEIGCVDVAVTGGQLLGDVSGDGHITTADVIRIAKSVVSDDTLSPAQVKVADVTGDGSVTNADVIRLAKYILGTAALG